MSCDNVRKIYRGHIDRIDRISQATHVDRSVQRWQASHPNLLITLHEDPLLRECSLASRPYVELHNIKCRNQYRSRAQMLCLVRVNFLLLFGLCLVELFVEVSRQKPSSKPFLLQFWQQRFRKCSLVDSDVLRKISIEEPVPSVERPRFMVQLQIRVLDIEFLVIRSYS
ncbi:hypothetical protein ACTXT7_013722 [Hymenolepis weldensis]